MGEDRGDKWEILMLHNASNSPVPLSRRRDQTTREISADLGQSPNRLELQPRTETVIVSGAFPNDNEDAWSRGDFVEIILDPSDSNRLAFSRWNNGTPSIRHEIERGTKRYVLPQKSAGLLADIVLSNGVRPSGGAQQLAADLESIISQFFELDPADLHLSVAHVLSSWVPECFETVPYLWLVGPPGSAKTTFLKLLSCLCRRSVLVGDIRPAALYQLVHNSDITLLIDELELNGSRSSSEIARLLRTGNTRGVPTVRNGQRFCTFCCKVLTSRLPPTDGALASRSLFVSMRPTKQSLGLLDEAARRRIIWEFQPRLLGFRFENLAWMRQYQSPPEYLYELTPRMKQLAGGPAGAVARRSPAAILAGYHFAGSR